MAGIPEVIAAIEALDAKVVILTSKVDAIKASIDVNIIPKIDETDDKVETIQTFAETKHNLKQVCTTCNGSGVEEFKEDNQPGVIQERPCPLCNGSKEILWGKITQ